MNPVVQPGEINFGYASYTGVCLARFGPVVSKPGAFHLQVRLVCAYVNTTI